RRTSQAPRQSDCPTRAKPAHRRLETSCSAVAVIAKCSWPPIARSRSGSRSTSARSWRTRGGGWRRDRGPFALQPRHVLRRSIDRIGQRRAGELRGADLRRVQGQRDEADRQGAERLHGLLVDPPRWISTAAGRHEDTKTRRNICSFVLSWLLRKCLANYAASSSVTRYPSDSSCLT